MVRVADGVSEISIDRQGRVVIPRHLRVALGSAPGTVRIREVEGGLLLESPTSGEVTTAGDGLPVLTLGEEVTNDEVLSAIDDERRHR